MINIIERPVAYFSELRRRWKQERLERHALQEAFRNATIRLCPGCQVPIEKNDGCDHMHCSLCSLHFSWRMAVPFNMATLENTGDGRFRFCPHCRYQNEKLHVMTQTRCVRCHKDFSWDEALFVPVVVLQQPLIRNRSRRASDDCGRQRQGTIQLSPLVRAWLDDPRRPPTVELETGAPSDTENDVQENLRCEICTTRAKTHALQCGHLFCEHCLVLLLRENPTCPIDRIAVEIPPMRIFL